MSLLTALLRTLVSYSDSVINILGLQATTDFYAARTSSTTQSRGAGTPTNTRATVATVLGYGPTAVLADGQTLLTVAADEARHKGARRISEGVWSTVDADGVPIPDSELDGALIEAEAQNLCPESNTFTTTWAAAAGAFASSYIQDAPGPDGSLASAWTCSDSSNTLTKSQYINITVTSGLRHVAMAHIGKTVGAQASYPLFTIFDGAATGYFILNTTTGVVTNATAGSINETIEVDGDSYGDFWIVYVLFPSAGTTCQLQLVPAGSSNGTSVDATATGSSIWYGIDLKQAAYQSAYIPTAGGSATRNKDILDDQVSGNLTAAAGSVAFEWTPTHDPSGTIALGGSYVDASNYTVLLHDATKYILRKRIAATNYDAELTAAYANGTSAKIALYFGASGSNIAVDGVLGTPHANTTAAQLGTRWQWGADGNGGQQAGAAFKDMYLQASAVSDAQLVALSA